MIKVFEMFSGYGGASFALKKAGIEFECVGFSEIDKYAIQCYQQNHKGKNYGDCTKINPEELPDFDLLTGGFPCQSFSVAGKGLGELDTRGTLFNEIIRIAEAKQPKYMLLENVKGLTFKTHKKTFDKILSELNRIGYYVKWKVLNSKEYGIPQNRERVFFVCFRNFGEAIMFNFPKKVELKLFLKDILEDEVDEKYYLSEKAIKRLDLNNDCKFPCWDRKTGKAIDNISSCLRAGVGSGNQEIIRLNNPTHSNNRVYSPNGISPTLNTMQGGNRQPKIMTVNSKGEKINNVPEIGQAKRIYSGEGITPALNVGWTPKVITHSLYPRSGDPKKGETGYLSKTDGTSYCLDTGNCQAVERNNNIRKLTPTECFRLMGFLNDEIKMEGLSNTQRYKLAGNGWDINLVSKIFKQMFNK